MELRHLRYFVAVAEALSFTKGAEKLHLAQPSLTRQIKDLEDEIHVRLIDRTKQQVSLTSEGRLFLVDARRVIELSEEIVRSVQRVSHDEPTPLNIGYVANLFYDLLPVTLASFQRSFPRVSINLFDMTCGDQFRALEASKIDLAFVGMHESVVEHGFEFRSIASYETYVALARNNRLAKESVIKLKDLRSMFFIGMSEQSYPGYRTWLTQTCQNVGFSPRILQDAEIERTLIQAVSAGLGVALLPDQARKLPHENVVFRALNPTVYTESCIAWKTNNPSLILKAYIDVVCDRGTRMR
ncbi:MAG: LysR substrate-binding domain-containing protein [Verrucomicrobiota bacterium]